MSWQRRLAPLALVVVIASACSGGGEQPTTDQAAPVTTVSPDATTTTKPAESPTTSSTKSISGPINDAPQSLAFSSSSDLGRLFEIDGSVSPAESAGSDTTGPLLSDGTVVQTTNLRANDGEIWARVNTTELDSEVLGWVPADSLRPTTQSIERFDPDRANEFRKVSRAVVDDLLDIYASPGGTGSTTGSLIETEVAMHGGNDVLMASGESWVDVVDPTTNQRLGWVLGESFTTLTSIEAKRPDGTDVDRRADPSASYGGDISAGDVTAVGCNAQQISFRALGSSRGSAIVFGNVVPTGTPLRGSTSEFRWSATGGSTVYVDAGETVTFTFPSADSAIWYFTTLGDDGQPEFRRTGDGAVATDVQQFVVDRSTCGVVVVQEPEVSEEESETSGTLPPASEGQGDNAGTDSSSTDEGDGESGNAPSVQGDNTAPTPPGDTVPPTGAGPAPVGDSVPPS